MKATLFTAIPTLAMAQFMGNLQPSPGGPNRMLRQNLTRDTGFTVEHPAVEKYNFLEKLINFFQDDLVSGKFQGYGCWCFNDEMDLTKGHGKPVDQIDESCRSFSHCYQCTKMAYDCSIYEGYKYFAKTYSNGSKVIECLNDEFGSPDEQCRHTLCQCDRKLAESLAKHSTKLNEEFREYDLTKCTHTHTAKTSSASTSISNQQPSRITNPLRVIDNTAGGSPSLIPLGTLNNIQASVYDEGQDEYASDISADIYDSGNDFMDYASNSDAVSNTGNAGDELRNLFDKPMVIQSVQTYDYAEEELKFTHQCCGDAPNWFPYNDNGGRRDCCNGKTYDTAILTCCDDGQIRSSC